MESFAGVSCPLCFSRQVSEFAQAHDRDYLACAQCSLVFLSPSQRTPADAELAHYRTHRNDAYDPSYRAFLSRLADPLVERLPPGAEGLDYGSGTARPLEIMLGEQGYATLADVPGEIDVVVVFDRVKPDMSLVQSGPRPVRVLANTRTPGLAGARNTGIVAATGELIAFCDDDDYWLPTKIASQVEQFQRVAA